MFMRKSEMAGFALSMVASGLVWALVGASIPMLVMGSYAAAAVLLGLALCLWPFRLKVRVRRITADSFEEAMREIMKHEREDRQ